MMREFVRDQRIAFEIKMRPRVMQRIGGLRGRRRVFHSAENEIADRYLRILRVRIGHSDDALEDGAQLPSLANALMLGYLLKRPVEELFGSVREDVIRQAEARKKEADANDGEEDEKARGGITALPFRTGPPVPTPDTKRSGAGWGSRRKDIYVR